MTAPDENLPGMIGRHDAMRAMYRLVRKVAPRDIPVLIVGETGTGKELVARALHSLRFANGAPFVDVNCAAVPESIADAELFGAERGAYTGADRRRAGLLEQAHHGTLFLDEVCSMPLGVQAKLLRAIEHGTFRRVGGCDRVRSAFRTVAAVSEPVSSLVTAGQLREDLAYRLAGLEVVIPPLRCRRSDIGPLAEQFLTCAGTGHRLDGEAQALLCGYAWPGNVRQLKTVVERLAILVDEPLVRYEHVLGEIGHDQLDLLDRESLRQVLARTGSIRAAARALEIPQTTLRRRLKALDLLPSVRRGAGSGAPGAL